MILGKINTVQVLSKNPGGYILVQGDTQAWLMNRDVQGELERGQELEVFIYEDSDKRLRASMEEPKGQLGDFVVLEIVSVTNHGYFLDWGLDKDLFLPLANAIEEAEVGDEKLVYILLDEQTNRLVATEKIERHLDNSELYLEPNQTIRFIPYRHSPLGYQSIIMPHYAGLLHTSDAYMPLELGETYVGHVKNIREDLKVDLAMGERGYKKVEKHEDEILVKLKQNEGYIPLHDKSSPEDIYAEFQMSKKTFKKAIGALYKSKKIRIAPDGIYLAQY